MNDFRASLACVLLVLGQLCLNSAIGNNTSVDFSIEMSAVLILAAAVVSCRRHLVVKLQLTMEALKQIFSSVNK